MKILFSAGELDKELNANTKIVLQLAEYMAAAGHEVAVCGICYYKPCDEKVRNVLMKKISAPKFLVSASEAFENFISKGDRNALRGQFIKKHPFKSVMLAVRYNALYMEKVEQPRYLKGVKNIVNSFKPDVLVLPYKPINSFEHVVMSDIAVPMVAYHNMFKAVYRFIWKHQYIRFKAVYNVLYTFKISRLFHLFHIQCIISHCKHNAFERMFFDKLSPQCISVAFTDKFFKIFTCAN